MTRLMTAACIASSLVHHDVAAERITDETTKFFIPKPKDKKPKDKSSPSDDEFFRLRIYWEKGYKWQNTTDEMYWCMECESCDAGDSIYTEWCTDKTKRQTWFTIDDTIRPKRNESLCITTTGHSETKPIRLYECEESNPLQQFKGITKEGKFELKQPIFPDRCVTVLHHPKSYERIYPELCSTARYDTASNWIKY